MTLKRHPLNTSFDWHDALPPFRRISREQADSWNNNGYFLLENAFSPDTLAAVAAVIDPLEAKVNEYLRTLNDKRQYIARADELTFALHAVKDSEVAKQFALHSVFADLCLDLLGPDARLYWDQAVYKKAGCQEEFPWHQDNGYNFVEPQDYLTCWVPLTDATVENGCPWVMPGVHRMGTLNHWKTELGWQCLDGMEGAIPVEARAGDVVVFSSLTPHRTGPNHTAETRKSYILQYAHGDSVMLQDDGKLPVAQNDPQRQFPIVSNGQRMVSD
ncbi:MAG: phytanoyl-CoA dioxygenase family protein [Pseudomonadales bacterium]|nr:phytanoyl-CoA dioxygenase family protein [Pseudomonadales bacterium]